MTRRQWPLSKNCPACGCSFIPNHWHADQKYCSLSCHTKEAKRKYRMQACPVCDGPFLPYAPTHRYCSVSCANTARDPKPVCLRGHAFDDENTYVRPDGERECRACKRARRDRSAA